MDLSAAELVGVVAHEHGNERLARLGFTGGFVVMLVLDNARG